MTWVEYDEEDLGWTPKPKVRSGWTENAWDGGRDPSGYQWLG